MPSAFYATLNDLEFNPDTGGGATPNLFPGPLQPLTASLLSYKCTAMSVDFKPTLSQLNNAGEVHCMFWSRPMNASMESDNTVAIPMQ